MGPARFDSYAPWLAGRRRRAVVSTDCGSGPPPVCTATPRAASRRGFPRAFWLARRSVSPIGSTCSFAATLMTWATGAPRTPRRAHPETRNSRHRTFCGQRTAGGSPRRTWTPTSPVWAGPRASSTPSSQIQSSAPSPPTGQASPGSAAARVGLCLLALSLTGSAFPSGVSRRTRFPRDRPVPSRTLRRSVRCRPGAPPARQAAQSPGRGPARRWSDRGARGS